MANYEEGIKNYMYIHHFAPIFLHCCFEGLPQWMARAFGADKNQYNKYSNDIRMANYEKQVEQEAAYPIPISLYSGYRTVRHQKRYQE